MNHFSLSELNRKIRDCLEANLNASYWVIAEVSELKVNQKGHCYLELVEKDGDNILAKSRATIWSYTYRNLSLWFESMTGEALRPGMKILSNVNVGFHEVYGLSLNIKDIDAGFTIGERALRRQEIMKKLVEDGVADMNKELPLPLVPQRIAVISAPTAAGYQDFTDQLNNNEYNFNFSIKLFPALMQGKEAVPSILGALHSVFRNADDYDLVVIIRGGGAVTDLDCFDNYDVAGHVAQFPLPVITGIGHEKDETIMDLVAHTHLKTPTAVAEFIISGTRQFEETLDETLVSLDDIVSEILDNENSVINEIAGNLGRQSRTLLNLLTTNHKLITNRFYITSKNTVEKMNTYLLQSERATKQLVRNRLSQENETLRRIDGNLNLVNINSIMKRGFSIVRNNGHLVIDSGTLNSGDLISIEFYKGKADSIIKKSKK